MLFVGILDHFCALNRYGILFLEPSTPFDLSLNAGGVSLQKEGNIRNSLLDFQQAVYLVSFFSPHLFVNWAYSAWRLNRA
jgi:hypothetical protein